MEGYKTSTLSNGLLWFGAAVSIAEIFTGTLFVPLGFTKGFAAIITGHLIGCILLYYAGIIGAQSGKSSMESVGLSFGSKGRNFFAFLNVLQLVGWTAVMIIQGARAMGIMLNTNIGILGAAIFTGESDIATIMLKAGFGIFGVLIILFSTVTTTYLDVYLAGVSLKTINSRLSEKAMSILICIIGVMIAMFSPVDQYENFLYLIGSVFAPMVAVLISDYFILKKDNLKKTVDVTNFIVWFIGFAIYRMLLNMDIVIGSTIPVIIITVIICLMADKITASSRA